MTQPPYPLTPVVTSSATLTERYNQHFMSQYYLSACMTPEACQSLLQQGAQFDKIILLDANTEALYQLLGQRYHWGEQAMPEMIDVSAPQQIAHATVASIHALIAGDPNRCGMG